MNFKLADIQGFNFIKNNFSGFYLQNLQSYHENY
jgi:hypothetical protein